jgi:SAM-dependent methyltransferase
MTLAPKPPLCDLYTDKPHDFYAQQLSGKGLRAVWFRKRQFRTYRLLVKYYKGSAPIVDIGCGNVLWNRDTRPVIGIDICSAMLSYNKKSAHSFRAIQADFMRGIPLEDSSVECVVVTEVLEHVDDCAPLIREIKRILKPGGIVIVSVPFGRFPGMWSVLFTLWCYYKWFFKRDRYYKNKCGHRVSFNMRSLCTAFNEFTIVEQSQLLSLTLFLVARKEKHD